MPTFPAESKGRIDGQSPSIRRPVQPRQRGFIKVRRDAQQESGNFKFDGRRFRRLGRRGSHRDGRKDRLRRPLGQLAPRSWSAPSPGQLSTPEVETGLAQAARAAELPHRDRLETRTLGALHLNPPSRNLLALITFTPSLLNHAADASSRSELNPVFF